MVGQHQELVPVLTVPADDLVRGAVAIAVERVGVGVPLEPMRRARGDDGLAGHEQRLEVARRGGEAERQDQQQDPACFVRRGPYRNHGIHAPERRDQVGPTRSGTSRAVNTPTVSMRSTIRARCSSSFFTCSVKSARCFSYTTISPQYSTSTYRVSEPIARRNELPRNDRLRRDSFVQLPSAP